MAVPSYAYPGFCGATLTTTTDPDGHGVLAWGDWNVARLWPAADLNALTGAAGPVGLY